MFGFWFFGFVAFIIFRAFYAGMKSSELFYNKPGRYDTGPTFNDNLVLDYIFATVGIALSWPITLPIIGLYILGKRFAK